MDNFVLAGFLVLTAGVLSLCFFLAILPGRIARKRGHANAEAIALCGFLGLLFLPCWFIALVWAYTNSGKELK